jgi:hypothetical protein
VLRVCRGQTDALSRDLSERLSETESLKLWFSRSKEAEADQGTGQVQERQHGSGLAVVADGEPAERHYPGQTALNHPSEATEPLVRVHAASSDPRRDPALA